MMFRQHLLSGAAVYMGGYLLTHRYGHVTLTPSDLILGTEICALAAIAPDIDHPGSKIARFGGSATQGAAWLVSRFGHRGVTHWLTTAAALTGAAWLLVGHRAPWLVAAIGAGLVTHVLGDGLTDMGIPLFGPFSSRYLGLWKPLRFKAGRWVEWRLVCPPMTAGTVALAATLAGWPMRVVCLLAAVGAGAGVVDGHLQLRRNRHFEERRREARMVQRQRQPGAARQAVEW